MSYADGHTLKAELAASFLVQHFTKYACSGGALATEEVPGPDFSIAPRLGDVGKRWIWVPQNEEIITHLKLAVVLAHIML